MELSFELDRRAAFRQGADSTSTLITLDIDPATLTEEQREMLTSRMAFDGAIRQRELSGTLRHYGHVIALLPTLDGLLTAITAEEAACQAFQQREREEWEARQRQAQHIIAGRVTRQETLVCYLVQRDGRWHTEDTFPRGHIQAEHQVEYQADVADLPHGIDADALKTTEAQEWLATLAHQQRAARDQAVNARFIAIEAEKARERAAEEAVRQEEARRDAQCAAWVAQHSTSNQKARFGEGMLSEDEILAGMRDQAFAALESCARYERLTASDVCTCDYAGCHVTYSVDEKPTLTAEQYEWLLDMRAALPDAEMQPRLHRGVGDACGGEAGRLAIRVRLVVDAYTFTREYAVA